MNKGKGTPKALFVVTSCNVKGAIGIPTGFNLSEVTHPLEKLEESGVVVDIASIKGGEAPLDGLEDLNDPINARYWADADFRKAISHTLKLDDVKASDYDAIFFAGGHGTMWDFRDSPAVLKLVPEFYESGKIVSAVCHGPAALVNVKLSDGSYLIAGKNVAGFTNGEEEEVQSTNVVPFLLEDALIKNGANYKHAPNWNDNIAIDERLITGQNPQSAASVGKALVKMLKINSTGATAPKPAFSNADVSSVSPALGKYIAEKLVGEVWGRPWLSKHDRCIVTLSCLIARNQSNAMPHYFIKALNNGITPGELSEIITHLAFYSGVPNAMSAVAVAKDVFANLGISQAELPSTDPLMLDKKEVLPGDENRVAFIQQNIAPISVGFAKYTNELLYGEVWLRSGLSSRSRSLATVCAMIAAGDTQFLGLYMTRAVEHGITRQEMGEALTQLAFYAGWPKLIAASLVVKEVYDGQNK
jgi:putative intracellular protease/amidase/alkylhydroperoxidase/carboxymuconolactone decarboxylase family protein YurZ